MGKLNDEWETLDWGQIIKALKEKEKKKKNIYIYIYTHTHTYGMGKLLLLGCLHRLVNSLSSIEYDPPIYV